jgi:hypothetical protein
LSLVFSLCPVRFPWRTKKRTYSPARIRYPLIRVDWDPKGERNTQNRGKSKYRRISWEEALDIIASEVRRIHKEYGPLGILVQGDGHGECKTIHTPHGHWLWHPSFSFLPGTSRSMLALVTSCSRFTMNHGPFVTLMSIVSPLITHRLNVIKLHFVQSKSHSLILFSKVHWPFLINESQSIFETSLRKNLARVT